MTVFDPVVLAWNGVKYRVPSSRRLRLIARVEEELTLAELQEYQRRKTAPVAKLALAYGAALRFAGCDDVDDDDVYLSIISGKETLGIMTMLNTLLMMMLPKEGSVAAERLEQEAKTPGKAEPAEEDLLANSIGPRSAVN